MSDIFTLSKGIRPCYDPSSMNQHTFSAEIIFPNEDVRLERRLFNIQTYSLMKNPDKISNWDKIQQANRFINDMLDKDEYDYLVRLFIRSKRDLMQIHDRQSTTNAIHAIDEKILKTFTKLALPERLFDYVVRDKNISLPDFTNIGKRPQDSEEKTFHEDEYHIINTIIVISKIIFPIFGEVISKVRSIPEIHSGTKEIVAFGIVNSLLSTFFDNIIKKLHHYFVVIIDQKLSTDPMLAFHGITETGLTYDKLAKLVVKDFVNIDLYRKDGNVMRNLAVTLKREIGNKMSESNKNIKYQPMLMQQENGEDGGNISFIENSVNVVSEPIEVPIMVRIAINSFVENYIEHNGINRSMFDQAVKYYQITTLPPTSVNELLVAMFIADPVGSAYCVKYLDMEMMIRIIVLIQIYAMHHDFKTIVPLLSMIPTGIIKTESDDVDNRIIIDEGRGVAGTVNYSLHLYEATSHLRDFAQFDFNELLKTLITVVTSNVHSYNVAPMILEMGSTAPTYSDNGIMKYDENIIADIHRFMYSMLITDTERKILHDNFAKA